MALRARALMALIVTGLLVACAVAPPSKDGGQSRTIRLAQAENLTPVHGRWFDVPSSFLRAISDASGGRLTVEVDATTYADGALDQESRLLRDLADGKVDATVTPTRAYANAGIPGLDVLEAPFVITSAAAEQAVVASPVAQALLDRLKGTGIVGLALVAGPMRRPVSGTSALLSPEDFAGQRIRSYNSPVEDASITALGGEPVHATYDWADQVRQGQLRGAESDLATIRDGDRARGMFMPTNVVLWPKTYLVAVSQQFYDGLTDEQRSWLRAAAERVRDASAAATYDESALARVSCSAGMRFATATNADTAALHDAVTPVLGSLGSDPLLAQEQRIVAVHPAVDTLDVGSGCFGAAAMALETWPTTGPAVLMLPDGRYRTTIHESEVLDAGYSNGDGVSGVWTLVVHDATYTLSCAPTSTDTGHDCGNNASAAFAGPLERGTIEATGHTLVFHSAYPDYSAGPWHLEVRRLTFDRPANGTSSCLWVNPWDKIG